MNKYVLDIMNDEDAYKTFFPPDNSHINTIYFEADNDETAIKMGKELVEYNEIGVLYRKDDLSIEIDSF